MGSVVLTIRSVQVQGGNLQFIAGVLALAQNSAISEGLNWPQMLDEIKGALDASTVPLLENALSVTLIEGEDPCLIS